MNNSLMDLLTEITVYDLILTLSLLSIGVAVLASQKSKISKWLDKWRKNKNEEEDFNNLVYGLRDSVTELKKAVEQFQVNREHDRDDSRKIRSEMYGVMNKQSESIKNLTDIVVKMQEKNSKTQRAELKEKIERIYSECHPAMTCTDMQLETLKELIEEYEEHGGNNSFIHTVVEPEMYTWKIIQRVKEA